MKSRKYIVVAVLMLCCAPKYKKSLVTHNVLAIEIHDSIKDKLEVLNDYLDNEKKDRYDTIMIMSRKININMTLRILRVNDIYSLDSVTKKTSKEDKTFYTEDEWEKTRKKYSKSSVSEIKNFKSDEGECCWTSGNFNYKNAIFEELHPGLSTFMKKYNSSRSYRYYSFSEPIYYKNKEYLIFTFFDGWIFDALSGNAKIIIYQKQNGKWVQTHEGFPDWIS